MILRADFVVDLRNLAIFADDERHALRHLAVRHLNAEVFNQRLIGVAQQWVRQHVLVGEFLVELNAVGAGPEENGAFGELLGEVAEAARLGGAATRQRLRIPEHDDDFALQVGDTESLCIFFHQIDLGGLHGVGRERIADFDFQLGVVGIRRADRETETNRCKTSTHEQNLGERGGGGQWVAIARK